MASFSFLIAQSGFNELLVFFRLIVMPSTSCGSPSKLNLSVGLDLADDALLIGEAWGVPAGEAVGVMLERASLEREAKMISFFKSSGGRESLPPAGIFCVERRERTKKWLSRLVHTKLVLFCQKASGNGMKLTAIFPKWVSALVAITRNKSIFFSPAIFFAVCELSGIALVKLS